MSVNWESKIRTTLVASFVRDVSSFASDFSIPDMFESTEIGEDVDDVAILRFFFKRLRSAFERHLVLMMKFFNARANLSKSRNPEIGHGETEKRCSVIFCRVYAFG